MSSPYRRFLITDPIGSPVGLVFAGLGYATVMRVTQDPRQAKGPRNPLAHRAHCRGKDAKRGRTNGLPWDGTSPVSAPATIDPTKTKPRKDAGLGLWQAKMRLTK